MNPLPGRFTGVARFAASFRPSRSGSTSPTHQSFRLTRPGKQKVVGRMMSHGYMTGAEQKKFKTIEGQIVHAAGAGHKTYIDQDGVEHKITDEMRNFAKEAGQRGHTLTKKSEFKKFIRGGVEVTHELGLEMKSGLNTLSEREAVTKIEKSEGGLFGESKEHHSALQERQAKLRERNARLARIGVQPNSMAAAVGSPAASMGSVQEVQPLTPGSAPAKPPAANRPVGLMTAGIIGGRHTDTADHPDEPIVVAPTNDPIAEENQTVAESIPPAKPVDLPDTTNVDRGLPF